MGIIVAIDMGGTNCRVAAYQFQANYSLEPKPLSALSFKMSKHTEESPGDFWKDWLNLRNRINNLRERHGRILGIGFAIAGKVHPDRTHLTGAGNLGHWTDQPIKAMLEAKYDFNVVLGNDAEAGGLAEAFWGAGRRSNFLFDILGTGFGGCFVNATGDADYGDVRIFAGEPGHMEVNPGGGLQCKCGQLDCLEAYVAGDGIRNRFGKPAEELSYTEWEDVLHYLAIGLRNQLCSVYADLVVFSGGIMCKQPGLLTALGDRLSAKLKVIEPPKLVISQFGESAGTLGALALFEQHSLEV